MHADSIGIGADAAGAPWQLVRRMALASAALATVWGLTIASAAATAAEPEPAPARYSEADLVKSYAALKASGTLEAAIKSPTMPADPPQAAFLDGLAWYAAGMPSGAGVLTRSSLDQFLAKQVQSYKSLIEVKVEGGADNDYPRTRTWKVIQKMTLLGREMDKPERQGTYSYPALTRTAGIDPATDAWDGEHTLRTAEEFRQKVCDGSFKRPVLVKFGNTNCTQCMLFELLGSVKDLAESPALKGKVDVYKVWFGFSPDDGFSGRMKNPPRLDDLAKGEGVTSSPTFAVYRNGRRYTCGDAFPDQSGHDDKLEACVRQEFGDAPVAPACAAPVK